MVGVGVLLIACGEPHGAAPEITPVPEDPGFVPGNGFSSNPGHPSQAPGVPNPDPVVSGDLADFEPAPGPESADPDVTPGAGAGEVVDNSGSAEAPASGESLGTADQPSSDAAVGERGTADAGVSFEDAGSVTDAGSVAMDARFGASPRDGDAAHTVQSP